eukprot:5229320-Ditylum_brightwellii.AAC.1
MKESADGVGTDDEGNEMRSIHECTDMVVVENVAGRSFLEMRMIGKKREYLALAIVMKLIMLMLKLVQKMIGKMKEYFIH